MAVQRSQGRWIVPVSCPDPAVPMMRTLPPPPWSAPQLGSPELPRLATVMLGSFDVMVRLRFLGSAGSLITRLLPPSRFGAIPLGMPSAHTLAVDVSTVISASPSPSCTLALTHGSGDAVPGVPVQGTTRTPSLKTASMPTSVPDGIRDTSRRNVTTSGLAPVAGGAEIAACWPSRRKPAGGG